MLSLMREKAQSWIIKFLFGIIIIVFVGFYGFSGRQDKIKAPIATIGDKKISLQDFQTAYKNMLQFYTNIYKNQLSDELIEKLGIKQQVLEQLINKEVLLLEAEKQNLRVSNELIQKQILENPAFQENGRFSQRAYEKVLSYYSISAKEFEEQQEQSLIVGTLEKMITEAVTVSEKEIADAFALEGETAKIEYVKFVPELIKTEMVVSEAETKDYYEKNKEDFMVPEKVRVSYLVFDPEAFEKKAAISEKEIEEYYQTDPYQFAEEEQVRARHILLKVAEKADAGEKEKARTRAQNLLKQINDGAAFEVLAKKFSEDTVSAEKGGDLGFFSRGAMVKPFEKVAFSLNPGEISDVVETKFGFHIIKTEEIRPAGVKPLEKVAAEIKKELKKEKAREMVRKEAKRAFNRLFKSRDLADYAAKNDLKLQDSGYFAYGRSTEDTVQKKTFSEEAFSLASGDLAPIFAIGQKYYLVKMEDRQEQHIPLLDKVSGEIEKIIRNQKRLAETETRANQVVSQLRQNQKQWKDLAKEPGLKIEKTEIKRQGDYVPGIGVDKTLKKEIFSLTEEQPYVSKAFRTENGVYLVRLTEKGIPDDFTLEKEKANITRKLLQKKKADLFSQYVEKLKEKLEIKVDPTLFPSA